MTQTSSPTLFPREAKNLDQITTVRPIEKSTGASFENDVYQTFLHSTPQLVECFPTFHITNNTNDGGSNLTINPLGFNLEIHALHMPQYSNFKNWFLTITIAGMIDKIINYPSRQISTPLILSQPQIKDLPHLGALRWIKDHTGLPQVHSGLSQDRIAKLLTVTRQTITNWENGGQISDSNKQRLFAVRAILELAARRYQTNEMLIAWLDTPRGADGRTPAELLGQGEINRARLLAISAPSPKLVRAPEWVKNSIPKAFRVGAEHRQEALPYNEDDIIPLDEDEESE